MAESNKISTPGLENRRTYASIGATVGLISGGFLSGMIPYFLDLFVGPISYYATPSDVGCSFLLIITGAACGGIVGSILGESLDERISDK